MRRKKKNDMKDYVGLRGGIEICLKNARTGEDIMHEKGDNTVLNIGRDQLMMRAFATASTTYRMQPIIAIGTGTTAANATNTMLLGYYSFRTGGFASTTGSDGTAAPILAFTASWDTGALTDTQFNVLREFGLYFQTQSTVSPIATGPMLCRYVSAAGINATTSNQLLVTYTVSF